MIVMTEDLVFSASDVTAAAQCEYAVLRTLDVKLGWSQPIQAADDPFLRHLARLGDGHERRLLAELRGTRRVLELPHLEPPLTPSALHGGADATLKAFADAPDVVYQAAFFDGEFFGYADFIERAVDGWLVCDAKLARSAAPKALIQLGAYADQLRRLDLPLSSRVALLLGNGERAEFAAADVLPVYTERRQRLRDLLTGHRAGARPVAWGDDRYLACGRCPECQAAVAAHQDVFLVAGIRTDQRRVLRGAGIATMADLAHAARPPAGMAPATFDKLHLQAALQWRQLTGDPATVTYQLTATAPKMLSLLPAPSAGDLFFDFEGDPLYDEGDPSRPGLEYLWGVVDADGRYTPTWAHSQAEERAAFVAFLDFVAERRNHYPDLHIFHYAPYETTALKRLAMQHQTREKELDDLLRSEVFVDLYATVRGSIRVSQPSYSIKKLEPLYMGGELRDGDVADGAGSVLAYQLFRDQRVDDPAAARRLLAELADYNRYDCVSTSRLRDWLLQRAGDAGVRAGIEPRSKRVTGEEQSEKHPTFVALMAKSGPEQRVRRTPEQQAYAMLATALDYFRRERKQYWWDHFDRLGHPIDDWPQARDVFVVESAEVVHDWEVPAGRARNARRVVRLLGDWAPGSTPGSRAQVVYPTPAPARAFGPDDAPYAAVDAYGIDCDPDDPRVVLLTESCSPDARFADLPVALVPGPPPQTANLEAAIHDVGAAAAAAGSLPQRGVLDILARRPPRLLDGAVLPGRAAPPDSVVAALTAMADSYLAIQGPPGTGKTYTGARVVKELVERHGWRVGVVAQSHAVVENLLAGIVSAGLDPALVGKAKTESDTPTWTALHGTGAVAAYLAGHAAGGCVVGGTAWDFANPNTVARDTLDLLVIDEAGQFSLASTLAASVAARRLLLLGDPQQLPQVSQGGHAEPVDESALGWLLDGHDTIPDGLGYFLGQSYRMHPTLCASVSVLSYDGKLHSSPAAARRRLDGVEPGILVVPVPHTGNRTESPEEADAVVEQVRSYVGRTWHDPEARPTSRALTVRDVLVVAPYNAQVAVIRAALDRAGLGGVRVGTVDKFQGQQAPIAIVSMTASAHGDVPRGMGFLLNRNRINVAVSRAQWRAVIVRSSALTSFLPSTAAGVLELGAFIGLCQPPYQP